LRDLPVRAILIPFGTVAKRYGNSIDGSGHQITINGVHRTLYAGTGNLIEATPRSRFPSIITRG